MLGIYLQQPTSADVIFQMHIFLGALRVNGLLRDLDEKNKIVFEVSDFVCMRFGLYCQIKLFHFL